MTRPVQQRLFEGERNPESDTRVTVRLWLAEESAKAVMFYCAPELPARFVWVARSLMRDVQTSRDPSCAYACWEFTLPRWKVEELGVDSV